ncbi:MAG: diphosphomevalonate decarboxylase [Deltaproteobacteria bacterium]|nr:diphosphomevalonate decarboxylase [Deltaproteobacteria bacterium]
MVPAAPVTASVTARACANIALVKYWGKREGGLNLPATGSLSLTLDALTTQTTVTFDETLKVDELELDGQPARPEAVSRITGFLDLVRSISGMPIRARVVSKNDFPTASGLASSASGFAALALAATRAAGLVLDPRALSILARRGSGSAARSVFGGFVRMHAGVKNEDAFAEPVARVAPGLVDQVRMVVAVVGGGVPKTYGSRSAMEHTAATSPMYRAWLDLVPRDLELVEAALAAGDLEAIGTLAEANALAMHASAIAARPAILYWRPATLAVLAEVRGLRATGQAAWATMDAGPHVKVLTTIADAELVSRALVDVPGVTTVRISGPGGPATIVDAANLAAPP